MSDDTSRSAPGDLPGDNSRRPPAEELLPRDVLADNPAWESARCDLIRWGPALRAVCRHHGFDDHPLTTAAAGTEVVVRTGGAVIKIYRPVDRRDRDVEARALELVGGRLSLPVPRLLARGDIGPCAYLVMSALDGEPLADAWESINDHDRRRLVADIGRGARELHELAVDHPGPLEVDWDEFVAGQRRTAAERQQARGLNQTLVEQIDGFLGRHLERLARSTDLLRPTQGSSPAPPAPPIHPSPSTRPSARARPSLLHTELMRDHFLVTSDGGRPRLSGLFDFADSLVGAPDYEFPAVGLFVTGGDRRLLRAFLLAYGFAPADLTPEFSRRMLAWTLCHRYANLPGFLARVPLSPPPATLEDLAQGWFGLAATE